MGGLHLNQMHSCYSIFLKWFFFGGHVRVFPKVDCQICQIRLICYLKEN